MAPTPLVGPTSPGVFFTGTFVISGQNFLGASVTSDGPFSLAGPSWVNATGTSISQRYLIGCCAPQEGQTFSLTVSTPGGSASATDKITLSPTNPGLVLAVVANRGSNNLSAFTLNTTTGDATPVQGSPFAAGIGAPNSVAIDSIHGFVYVAPFGGGTGKLSAFAVDSSTGGLTAVPGSPFAVGGDAIAVTVDPGGRFVYVANFRTDGVSALTINAKSGALAIVPGSPFAAGSRPHSVTVDPSGQFVYVANCGLGGGCDGTGPGSISSYQIDGTTGALTPVTGSPFAAGTNPFFVMVEPTGRFAYAANAGSANVSAFAIAPGNGTLTPVPGSPFQAGAAPQAIAFDPAGRFGYVANGNSSNISGFTINSGNGALTPIGTFTAGFVPVSLSTDPTGQFLYGVNAGFLPVSDAGPSSVVTYGINGFTGVLTPTGGVSVGTNPVSIAIAPITCSPPEAPASPAIAPANSPNGPVTATDFLTVNWSPPATGTAPTRYEYRINGDPYTAVSGTSATANPRGKGDPITLFVRAQGCIPELPGPEASSQVYSLAPPTANFSFSSGQANQPINFTDTSSPQATSWLWLFDDGGTSTSQSPSHTFTQGGTHNVALIASNGSGSTLKILPVPVTGTASLASTSARIGFESSEPERRRLNDVAISGPRQAWLTITSNDSEETIVYLRFLDAEGRAVLERRLSIPAGQHALNDVGAYGLEGTFTLELVSGQRFNASLADSTPCRNPKEDCDEQP